MSPFSPQPPRVLTAADRGSWSHLGLERDEAVRAEAMAALTGGGPTEADRQAVETALLALWEVPLALVAPARLSPATVLAPLLEPGDVVWVTPAVASRHRRCLDALRAAGRRVEGAPALEDLPAELAELAAVGARGWYMTDTFDPRTGQLAPLEALWQLHDRTNALRLVLDDTHGLGWAGRGGSGLALVGAPPAARLIVTASLAAGLGGELGLVTSPDPTLVATVRAASPVTELAASAVAMASAIAPALEGWNGLQAKLGRRLQVCDRILKAHGLPRVGPVGVPHRYVAVGAQAVAYTLVARLLTEGHLVSAVTVPGPSGPQPALRFLVSLGQPVEAMQALVEALARHLPEAFVQAGLSLEAMRQVHGWDDPAAPGDMVDLAAWRASRAKDRSGVKTRG